MTSRRIVLKEKVLRKTQIRKMHKMGEIRRAQEHQLDEVLAQTSKENHETIQQLTSKLQQTQAQMNSGRLSHVFSQPAMIPSSRSLLGINLDNRKTFLEITLLRLIYPEIILKEIKLTTCKEIEEQSLKPEGRRLLSQVKTEKIKAQFQIRHLQQNR